MTHCGVFGHMKLRHQVGLNIQKLRRERGISQEDLALMAKVNRGYMGKLENAKNSASLDMVERIATALNVVPSWLLVGDEPFQFVQRFDKEKGVFRPMEIADENSKPSPRKSKRLKANIVQEGVILSDESAVVVWSDYTWNNGEIIRYWEKGLENIPETMITVRDIATSKVREP